MGRVGVSMARRLAFFGYGYSAAALARRLAPVGWRFAATARGADKAAALAAQQIEPHLWPMASLEGLLGEGAAVLVSMAPDESGDPVLGRYAEELARLAERVSWLGYLSTTAVYGDWGGAEVDETSPLKAASGRGLARVKAEEGWLTLWREAGLPVHIFRLAGIYGPGRGPFEKLRAGRAVTPVKLGQVFGRIHADDIALALSASLLRPDPGRIYNVTDDHTCPPEEAMAHAAHLLGMRPPPETPVEAAGLSPMALSFYAESKRVSNARIKRELGVRWLYPGYREGFRAILEAEEPQGRLI